MELPEYPVVATVSPAEGDNHQRLQAEIDRLSRRAPDSRGIRGALLLRSGWYPLSKPLVVKASGIALRGEGQFKGGTELYFTATNNLFSGKSNMSMADVSCVVFDGRVTPLGQSGSKIPIVSDFVPTGARAFKVADSANLKAGDVVAVVRTPNQRWLDELGMSAPDIGWQTHTYEIAHQRRIVAAGEDGVTVDIPLVDPLERRFGGGHLTELPKSEVSLHHSGIEKMRITSTWSSDDDENHGANAVYLRNVENCWVRNVTAVHFVYSLVTLDGSSFNTIQDCSFLDAKSRIDGGRRYAFTINAGSLGNLVQRCYSKTARHAFVTGSRVTGPNVFLDCLAEDCFSDVGPHHRWATGILFDCVQANEIRVLNRSTVASGHGWSGAQILFWNCRASSYTCDAPLGAMNWAVGTIGDRRKGQWVPSEADGMVESPNKHVVPRSLYLEQLRQRLGDKAVASIASEKQIHGKMSEHLRVLAE